MQLEWAGKAKSLERTIMGQTQATGMSILCSELGLLGQRNGLSQDYR